MNVYETGKKIPGSCTGAEKDIKYRVWTRVHNNRGSLKHAKKTLEES